VTAAPVVLVHGVGLDATMWRGVAGLLGRDREVVSYDMISHGRAPRPPGPYALDLFVDQLADVADRISSEPGSIDVVGFSMGALVAQGFAARQPQALRRLALLHVVYNRTDAERAATLERVAEVRGGGFAASIPVALQRWFTPAYAETHPAVVDEVRRVLEANNVEAYANAYEVFATADAGLVATTGRITVPTLVMTGADDPRSTPGMSLRLAASLARGEALVLPGLRHLAPVEAPDIVALRLRAFFDADPDLEPDAEFEPDGEFEPGREPAKDKEHHD
jgi:(E)-2-((N-methylformamido)methylene)succinate hydrolase